MQTSNIGERGVKSIRIGGMRVGDLPIAEQARTREQMPLAEDTERQNEIENILKSSPQQRIEYLEARIKEAQDNIERIRDMRDRESSMISEYTTLAATCRYRDKLLARAKDDETKRAIKKEFPLYNVAKLGEQIDLFLASIRRADEVIKQDHESINELIEVLARCKVRDERLKALGARMA